MLDTRAAPYGRGSSDMKSGVAAFVAAAVELASQLQRGPGLRMVITAGEETGCQGAFELAKQDGVLGQVGALIVGEPTGNFPYVGHKGAFWLRAHTKGVTAHGSMPEHGVNAIYKAARALVVLEQFQFGVAQHQHLGLSSLNVGNITGGLNINSVPDAACIGIDIRTTPNVDHVALRARLQRELGDDVELETLLDVGSVFTDPAAPWIQSVFDTLTPYLGSRPEPRTATYFTDAAALNQVYRDPPTIILGPGEPQMAHQTDEYCLIDRVAQAQAVYRDLIQQWCRA